MNNEQFRRLAFGSGSSAPNTKKDASGNTTSATPKAAPAILGSRQRSSIPMTPRTGSSVTQLAFAKQMAERFGHGGDKKNPQQKKSKLSAPKGSRFAAGYVDRAKLRAEQEDDDGKAVPKGLDFNLLSKARNGELAEEEVDEKDTNGGGGDDTKDDDDEPGPNVDDEFAQLEKTEVQAVEKEKTKKRGQYSTAPAVAGQKRSRDQILAELKAAREAAKAAKAAEPVLGSRFKKIGAISADRLPGSSRIERDSRGRQVLVIVDEDGHEKRKVRKLAQDVAPEPAPEAQQEEDAAKPDGGVLGMEVPEFYRKKLEAEAAAEAEKEVNIFDDAGSDYDPLAGVSSSEEEEEEEEAKKDSKDDNGKTGKRRARSRSDSPRRDRGREDGEASDSDSRYSRDSRDSRYSRDSRSRDSRSRDSRSRDSRSRDSRSRVSRYRGSNSRSRSRDARRSPSRSTQARPAPATSTSRPVPTAAETTSRRNYFGASTLLSEETRGGTSLSDPSVLAALRKAKQLREATEADEKKAELSKEAEREARLKKLLQNSERDAEDMDLEFSVSRGGVEVEEDEERVRFSKWKGKAKGEDDEDDDEDGGGGKGGGGQKRRGKKRKGDGNNVADVMRVLESRGGRG